MDPLTFALDVEQRKLMLPMAMKVRALSSAAESWIDDHRLAVDGTLADAVNEIGAVLIGYRDLREVMRSS